MILLAAGVIMASLAAACLLLPYLFHDLDLPPERGEQEAEDSARIAAAEAALAAIARAQQDLVKGGSDGALYADAAAWVMELYRERIDARSKTGADRDAARARHEMQRRLQLIGATAERREIYRLARSGSLSDETARRLVHETDLFEARIGAV